MSGYKDEGKLNIPLNMLNKADLRFFVQVLKNAKVDQVDVYETDNAIFLTASSTMTYVRTIMKIPTKIETYMSVKIEDDTDEEETDLSIFDEDEDEDVIGYTTGSQADTEEFLAFSTEIGLLEALLIEDKDIEEIVIKVGSKMILLESNIYTLPFPKIRFAPSLGYYMTLMEDKMWETVDAVTVNRVAKAVSTLKVRDSDMYISLERDNVYSDNQDIIINAKSQELKNYYHFGYETITAFSKLTMNSPTVKVSNFDGESFLNVNNMFFVWNYPRDDVYTDNIMELFAIDKMDTIMVINAEMLKKLKTFLSLISEKDKDDVVKFVCIHDGLISVVCRDKVLKCRGQCLPGIILDVDLSFLIKAISISGSQTTILKANLYSSDVRNILIQGELQCIIGIEGIKREVPQPTPQPISQPASQIVSQSISLISSTSQSSSQSSLKFNPSKFKIKKQDSKEEQTVKSF